MDQYITSFSTPDADPFIISDVKSGKGGKLLVITEWIYPVMTLTFYIDPKTLELTTLDNSQSFF